MKKIITLSIIALCLAACQQEKSNNSAPVSTAPAKAASIANYKEKVDIATLTIALKKSGIAQMQGKEAEWNTRLAQAKSDAEIKMVLQEQLNAYRRANEALAGLKMQSEQGKATYAQLKSGLQGTQDILERLQKVDLTQPQGTVLANELLPQIKQHGRDIVSGTIQLMEMMKTNGFDFNEQYEKAFQEEIKEAQEKLK